MINDPIQISKLLIPSLRKKLVSTNQNQDLNVDYKFYYHSNFIYRLFNGEIFIYKYDGIGLQYTCVLNILDKNNILIDSKEIGNFVRGEDDSDAISTSVNISSNGIIMIEKIANTKKTISQLTITEKGFIKMMPIK